MNGRQSLYVLLVHGGIAAIVVLAATMLAYHGSIDSQTVSVIYGAALGLAGASASAIATLGSAVNGKMTVTPESVQAREVTLRQAIAAAPGAAVGDPAATPGEPLNAAGQA